MTSNYKQSDIDLDISYISASDINYFPLSEMNVSLRRIVTTGKNYFGNYTISNIGSAFEFGEAATPKVELDDVSLVTALPTAVIYDNDNVHEIRAQFNLSENSPQTPKFIGTPTSSPIQMMPGFWTAVDGANDHWHAVNANGTLWGCGYNNSYNLGIGNATYASLPVQVGTLSSWSSVASGGNHALALTKDGKLYSWGSNSGGQLGRNLGQTIKVSTPAQVGTLTDWVFISTINAACAAIRKNGTLWVWGQGTYYQLGLGDNSDRFSPVQNGTDSNWSKVAFGIYHTLAIKTDGTLWGCGYNNLYQLGLGSGNTLTRSTLVQIGTDTNWSHVCANDYVSLGIKTNGTLWAWGSNVPGIGGSVVTPTQIGSSSNWSYVGANYSSWNSFLLTQKDGTLWGWGNNSYGQLGINNGNVNVTSPTRVGLDSNYTITTTYDRGSLVLKDNVLYGIGSVVGIKNSSSPTPEKFVLGW